MILGSVFNFYNTWNFFSSIKKIKSPFDNDFKKYF